MFKGKKKVIFSIIIIVSLIATSQSSSAIISINNANFESNYQLLYSANPNYVSIESKTTSSQKQDEIDYVIITPQQFANSFNRLIDHKSQYLNAKIITKEEIISNNIFWVNGTYGDGINESNGNPWIQNNKQVTNNFSIFNDTAAKIRNFIRYAHIKWNTSYVLLGGDTEFIPYRSFYGFIPNWSAGKIVKSIQALIVSDHYFGALNGTWNNDFDNRFGEEPTFSTEEEADFSAEVLIGRAPVNDEHEINVFVKKVISYETSEKPKEVQLHQSYTNPQHIPDTTRVTDMCQQWIPEEYTIHTLYEKDGLVTIDQWIKAFSNPEKLLLFHVGNGYNDGLYSWYQLSWNGQKRVKYNVLHTASLSNSFYPIHLSISCLTGDFSENECLAEELLLTRNGGPSACIVNSEVGCISRDDAGAYSAEFFEQIFKNIFNESIQNLGETVQQAKEHFSSIAPSYRQYRWCFYEINLLGDPETPLFQKREQRNNSITVIVDDDFTSLTPGWNSTSFNSIQSAINAMPSYGKILINQGKYTEHLLVNKTITLTGKDKTNVILSNNEQNTSPLLTLACHSTIIENITIIWDAHTYSQPETIIHVLPDCNGNIIRDNHISGISDFGILLSNSIRNTITYNVISKSNIGIGLINGLGGLLPSKVIVTCDNIISHNKIEYHENHGIIIEGSIHNFILNNTFISNGLNNSKKDQFFFNEHLYLKNTKLNEIRNNYWNEPFDEPYPINSLNGPITIFSLDVSRGLVFKLFKCVLILNLGYPSIVFDPTPGNQAELFSQQ